MIIYRYNEKDKTLHIKIHILLEQVEEKPSEEELRKMLPTILQNYAKNVENGKMKIYDSIEWGLL